MARYKVGDKVVVKSWEDLLKAGYLDSDNDIIPTDFTDDTDWQFRFTSTMCPMCGQAYLITNVDYDGSYSVEDSNCFLEDWMLVEEGECEMETTAIALDDITGFLGELMERGMENLPRPIASKLEDLYWMCVSEMEG